MSILVLTLAGDPHAMGRQHGRQIHHLRTHLATVIEARLQELQRLGADPSAVVQPCLDVFELLDRPLLDYLAGMADSLAFERSRLLLYTLSSYLRDVAQVRGRADVASARAPEGCTTWAAAGPTTADGRPLLAKNRDYHADHIALQVLARVAPARGYPYLSLGSAGSPEVFSSGVNARGLAVADTHVLSHDIGPGLARFSLMRELLTHHASVAAALDYLRSVPHMGAGTLLLADASGALALCESGHRHPGYVMGGPGAPLASTNHFVTPALAEQWVEDEPPPLQGNSPARRARVLAALARDAGAIDLPWARALMSAHGAARDAICRHPLLVEGAPVRGLDGSTISSVLLLPAGDDLAPAPALRLAVGSPCQATWQRWPVPRD